MEGCAATENNYNGFLFEVNFGTASTLVELVDIHAWRNGLKGAETPASILDEAGIRVYCSGYSPRSLRVRNGSSTANLGHGLSTSACQVHVAGGTFSRNGDMRNDYGISVEGARYGAVIIEDAVVSRNFGGIQVLDCRFDTTIQRNFIRENQNGMYALWFRMDYSQQLGVLIQDNKLANNIMDPTGTVIRAEMNHGYSAYVHIKDNDLSGNSRARRIVEFISNRPYSPVEDLLFAGNWLLENRLSDIRHSVFGSNTLNGHLNFNFFVNPDQEVEMQSNDMACVTPCPIVFDARKVRG